MIFFAEPDLELNLMVFTMASQAAGYRHCQTHGAYGLGVDLDKVTALWSFETSDLFDDRERAALRFGLAAGTVPNAVTAEYHAELRRNFSDTEVRTLLGVVGLSGFMNRFNDSLATVTDAASSEWAARPTSVPWVGTSASTPAPNANAARAHPAGLTEDRLVRPRPAVRRDGRDSARAERDHDSDAWSGGDRGLGHGDRFG